MGGGDAAVPRLRLRLRPSTIKVLSGLAALVKRRAYLKGVAPSRFFSDTLSKSDLYMWSRGPPLGAMHRGNRSQVLEAGTQQFCTGLIYVFFWDWATQVATANNYIKRKGTIKLIKLSFLKKKNQNSNFVDR